MHLFCTINTVSFVFMSERPLVSPIVMQYKLYQHHTGNSTRILYLEYVVTLLVWDRDQPLEQHLFE